MQRNASLSPGQSRQTKANMMSLDLGTESNFLRHPLIVYQSNSVSHYNSNNKNNNNNSNNNNNNNNNGVGGMLSPAPMSVGGSYSYSYNHGLISNGGAPMKSAISNQIILRANEIDIAKKRKEKEVTTISQRSHYYFLLSTFVDRS
jgi:hypothetical protein